jgi:hypothetical protein
MESGLILPTVRDVPVIPASLMTPALLWLHLEVGGEDVLPLRDQQAKVGAVSFDGHLDATRVDVLRPTHKFDASPHWRDAQILEPNTEFGG